MVKQKHPTLNREQGITLAVLFIAIMLFLMMCVIKDMSLRWKKMQHRPSLGRSVKPK